MDYARESRFKQSPPRSIFVDGEVALMLGARRVIADREDHESIFQVTYRDNGSTAR